MDYNVAFYVSSEGLQEYKEVFDADSVAYLAGTWSSASGEQYTSIIVQVPNTQVQYRIYNM